MAKESDMSAPTIDFNPFADEIIDNPYPGFALLRKYAPVYEVETLSLRIISRYDDVVAALRDHESFSSTIIDASFSGDYTPVPGSGDNDMMAKDPPDHTRLRRLVNRAFTPKAVANMGALHATGSDDLSSLVF